MIMHKSVLNISAFWFLLLLLIAGAHFSSLAIAQQPAPKASPPTSQSQVAPPQTTPQPSRDIKTRVTETLIDSSIPDDPDLDKLVAVYSPKVHTLDLILGKLKGELRKGGMGAGSLGNFVTDGMRSQGAVKLGKPIDLAIMNSGGLRRNTIAEGELRVRDIFELLPFENALVTLDLTGEQLLKILGVVVSSREAQSGAQVTYITKADKSTQFEAAKLLDQNGREGKIDPKAIYSVVTIDYLINVGGDRYAVLREGKNTRPLGITLRDAIIEYVKSETATGRDIKPRLDGRFVLDRGNSVLSGEVPPR